MVGLPVTPADPSVDTVFAGVTMLDNSVYEYGADGYMPVTEVEPKVGYWVYSYGSPTITVAGTPVTS